MSVNLEGKQVGVSEGLRTTKNTIITTFPSIITTCNTLISGGRWKGIESVVLSEVDITRIKIAKAHVEDILSKLEDIGAKLVMQDELDGLKTDPLSPEEAKMYNKLGGDYIRNIAPVIREVVDRLKSFDTEKIVPLHGKR